MIKWHYFLLFSLKMPVHQAKQNDFPVNCSSLVIFFFLLPLKYFFCLSFFVFCSSSHFSLVFLLSYSKHKAFNQAGLMISIIWLSGVFGILWRFSLFQCSYFFYVFESHVLCHSFHYTLSFLLLCLFNKEICIRLHDKKMICSVYRKSWLNFLFYWL